VLGREVVGEGTFKRINTTKNEKHKTNTIKDHLFGF
jgi:hypothetical protein